MKKIQPVKYGDTGSNVDRLIGFLLRYGYMDSLNRDNTHVMRFDEKTVDAIKLYQRLHNLSETAILDERTLQWINTSRCGNADVVANFGFRYSLWVGWGRKNITFAADLVNNLPPIGIEAIKYTITQSLNTWSSASGIVFSNTFPSDIFIAFRRGDHGDDDSNLVFDNRPGGVLGHGLPPGHQRLPGQVHLDADEKWSVDIPVTGSADLVTLLLHEIGHALGLQHIMQEPSAVMNERFEFGTARRVLSPFDVSAIRALY